MTPKHYAELVKAGPSVSEKEFHRLHPRTFKPTRKAIPEGVQAAWWLRWIIPGKGF